MPYLERDQDGTMHYPIMGGYGIGIGRLAASVCEAKHDEYGPIGTTYRKFLFTLATTGAY